MSRQSEYKKKFNPETGKFIRQHIHGEGYKLDILKSISKKVFGQTVKNAAAKGATKAMTEASIKTGDYVGKKAGDKIVKLLSKEKKPKSTPKKEKPKSTPKKEKPKSTPKNVKQTKKELDQRLNNLLSGGSKRKKII